MRESIVVRANFGLTGLETLSSQLLFLALAGGLLLAGAAATNGQTSDPATTYKMLCGALGVDSAACPIVTSTEAKDRLDKAATAVAAYEAGAPGALAAVRAALGLPPAPETERDDEAPALVREVSQRLGIDIPAAPPTAARRLPIGPVSHPDPNVLERSYLFPIFQGNILDAQIAPHLFFYDNFKRLYEAPEIGEQSSFRRRAVAWSLTPMIRVRILNKPSGPVKTLSWMPKTDFQYVTLWRDPKTKPEEAGTERPRALTILLTLGHHSNGQDECTYVRGLSDQDVRCVDPATQDAVRINYPNGSFSTNYLRFGLTHKWLRLAATPSGISPRLTHSVGVSFETHPEWLKIGGTLPDVLRSIYGVNRFRAQYEFEARIGPPDETAHPLLRGSIRVTGGIEVIDKTSDGPAPTFTTVPDAPLNALWTPGRGSSRLRYAAEVAYNPDAFRGWGLVARYAHGQDPYNLLYVRDIHWFQAGIVFDAGEFQRFVTKGQK